MKKAILIFLLSLIAIPSTAVMPMVNARSTGVLTRTAPTPPAVVVTSGMVHWWKADEGTGTAIEDYGSEYPSGWADIDGVLGGTGKGWITRTKEDSTTVNVASISQNGYINVATNDSTLVFGTRDWSMDWWMKNSRTATVYCFWQEGEWSMQIVSDHNDFLTGVGGVREFASPYVDGANDGTWHHWCYTKDHTSDVAYLYKDGVGALASNFSATSYPNTGRTTIGDYDQGAYSIIGGIGSVKIYNRALTADEALQNHNAEK